MPIEGNHSFLRMHAKVAMKAGISEKNILIADNGQVIECQKGICRTTREMVASEYVFVDGLGEGDVGEIVLRDRNTMAEEGMFVIIALVDSKTGEVKGSPDIVSRGFIYLKENNDLLNQVRKRIKDIVTKSSVGSKKETMNWAFVRDELREKIGQFLYTKTKRRPMILPVVIEV